MTNEDRQRLIDSHQNSLWDIFGQIRSIIPFSPRGKIKYVDELRKVLNEYCNLIEKPHLAAALLPELTGA